MIPDMTLQSSLDRAKAKLLPSLMKYEYLVT